MPYKKHRHFRSSLTETSKIWRYRSLERFHQIVETSTLFFCRFDKFEDHWEGALPNSFKLGIASFHQEMAREGYLDADGVRAWNEKSIQSHKNTRFFAAANCWHHSNCESDALWKLYASEGVAIQSSFGSIKKAFANHPEDVYFGEVRYVDHETVNVPNGNIFPPLLLKRKCFSYEQEVRLVIWREGLVEGNTDNIDLAWGKIGQAIKVNLDALIDSIYVSPGFSDEHLYRLRIFLRSHNLSHKTVKRSQLSDEPIW